MADDPRLKLDIRLSPDGPPDPQVLDDLIRLIKQGVATAPKAAPQVADAPESCPPEGDETRKLEAAIRERIERASAASVAAVAKRAEVAAQPDGAAKLANESLKAAEGVVSAVGRAILRGVAVRVANEHAGAPADPPGRARDSSDGATG